MPTRTRPASAAPRCTSTRKCSPGLDEIETDLPTRRARAQAEGRLGELEGIDLTLTFLSGKRDQASRLNRTTEINLGLPSLRETS